MTRDRASRTPIATRDEPIDRFLIDESASVEWIFHLHFERDSSDISIGELARLSAWSSGMRSRFPVIDVVWLAGLSESTERRAQQLARRRAENVMNALDQFGITGERSAFIGRIYQPVPQVEQTGRRVEVNVGPRCPDHCCRSVANARDTSR